MKRTYFIYDDDGNLLGKSVALSQDGLDNLEDVYDDLEQLIAEDFEYHQEQENA